MLVECEFYFFCINLVIKCEWNKVSGMWSSLPKVIKKQIESLSVDKRKGKMRCLLIDGWNISIKTRNLDKLMV